MRSARPIPLTPSRRGDLDAVDLGHAWVDRLHFGRHRPGQQQFGSAHTHLAVEGQQQHGLTGEVPLESATVPAAGRGDGSVHRIEIFAEGGTHLNDRLLLLRLPTFLFSLHERALCHSPVGR